LSCVDEWLDVIGIGQVNEMKLDTNLSYTFVNIR